MRTLFVIAIFTVFTVGLTAQRPGQKIFETERAFEKTVAEKGVRDGFMEFLSPFGVMFMPDVANAREVWKARPASASLLTWNPVWIDVAANGAIGYSVGNSKLRAKGKDDPNIVYGHYLSIWMKRVNGNYLVELDAGITHDGPSNEPADWRSPVDAGKENLSDVPSAADSSIEFYMAADKDGAAKAYRSFLADDGIVLRQGKLPAFDKKSAIVLLRNTPRIEFSKRKLFTEAGNLGYVHGPYAITDKKGIEVERGNFVQVWKFRNKKWLIVADLLVPLAPRAG